MLEIVASLTIATLATLCCLALAVGMGLLPPTRVPVPLMKILDEMTDRPLLRQLIAGMRPPSEAVHYDAATLREEINNRLFGQEEVVHEIVAQLVRNFAKKKRRKSIGVFMISGPPGTGKTELGKAIGETLYGPKGHKLIEMNKIKSEAAMTTLFGASPGLIGSDRKASLVTHLSDHPQTVVILDEFEKAPQEVQEGFLNAWQNGVLTENTRGDEISTTDVIFVLTANAKQREIAELAATTDLTISELSSRCKDLLKDEFIDRVMSRVDYVFAFKPLTAEVLAAIALKMIKDELQAYEMTCKPIPPQVLLPYIERYFGPRFDARDLARQIEREFGESFRQLDADGVVHVEVIWNAKKQEMAIREVKAA